MKIDTVGENNPNWKGGLVSQKCKECGGTYKTKRNRVIKGLSKFCSRSCVSKFNGKIASKIALSKRIIKNCVVCDKKIFIKPSHVGSEGTYCSKECMAMHYKSRLRQENNPNYRHGESGSVEWNRRMCKKWRNNNKDKIANINRNTKARRRKSKGTHTLRDIEVIYLRQKGVCVICRKKLKGNYHVDHIMPIVLGGSNNKENLQILCPTCNMQKSSKDPIDFMRTKGFLL